MAVLGIILDMSGFDETLPSPLEAAGEAALMQPETALTWVSHSFTLLPGIFMVLVFVVMLWYPVNAAYMRRLREK